MVKRDHGGKKAIHLKGIIDFSSNINCFGPPESVRRLFQNDLCKEIISYPDPDYPQLKEALSKYTGRKKEEIFLGNGSVEIFFWIAHFLRPRQVLAISPGFCEYFLAGKSAGGKVVEYFLRSEENFSLNLQEIKKLANRVDLLFIGNPNNPTGNLFERDKIFELADSLKTQAVLIIDEAFMDFCEEQDNYSLLPYIRENIWVIRSLTKFFSLAGLRIGCLLAPAKVVAEFEQKAPPWRINRVAELAAISALSEEQFIKEIPSIISEERENFFRLLQEVDYLRPFSSVTNFILVKVTHDDLDSTRLKELLLSRGFLIRDASTFSGLSKQYIRLAVRKPAENVALVEELKRLGGG